MYEQQRISVIFMLQSKTVAWIDLILLESFCVLRCKRTPALIEGKQRNKGMVAGAMPDRRAGQGGLSREQEMLTQKMPWLVWIKDIGKPADLWLTVQHGEPCSRIMGMPLLTGWAGFRTRGLLQHSGRPWSL